MDMLMDALVSITLITKLGEWIGQQPPTILPTRHLLFCE